MPRSEPTAGREDRAKAYLAQLQFEIDYLKTLKTNPDEIRKPYSVMVLKNRLSMIGYQLKYKKTYGNPHEAFPKDWGSALPDFVEKALPGEAKETTALLNTLER